MFCGCDPGTRTAYPRQRCIKTWQNLWYPGLDVQSLQLNGIQKGPCQNVGNFSSQIFSDGGCQQKRVLIAFVTLVTFDRHHCKSRQTYRHSLMVNNLDNDSYFLAMFYFTPYYFSSANSRWFPQVFDLATGQDASTMRVKAKLWAWRLKAKSWTFKVEIRTLLVAWGA